MSARFHEILCNRLTLPVQNIDIASCETDLCSDSEVYRIIILTYCRFLYNVVVDTVFTILNTA